MTVNNKVDRYLAQGCGRCPKGGTPACNVHDWQEELKQLRRIVLDCGLTEELKWGVPCYTCSRGRTLKGTNVFILSAFKEYCAISFFNGVLLRDPACILIQQTQNVQASRQIRFTNLYEVAELVVILKEYICEANELERA